MIHPDTELKFVSEQIGFGVFATKDIPKGTITFVKDSLDIELTEEEFLRLSQIEQTQADKFSYIDERGMRVLSWDHGKYVNHSCEPNTMSTGFGFEIALRDIIAGEEITDEYGLFNIPVPIPLSCGCESCRGELHPSDHEVYADTWDERISSALDSAKDVSQPLWEILPAQTRLDLMNYLSGGGNMPSVRVLKYYPVVQSNLA